MPESNENQLQMDPSALYREEVFTDQRVGVIKRLTPVTADGDTDSSREILYRGETQIMLGNNPMPIAFELDVTNIGEAAEKFSEEAQKAAEDTIKRLEEMRREMQSQIVVPGQGGGMPGGMGGGGNIQMP